MLPSRFRRDYEFLQKEFKRATISKLEFSSLDGISKSTVDNRMCKGMDVPDYFRLSESKNSTVRFTLIDTACYTSGIELDSQTKYDLLHEYLFNKYRRIIITRKIFCYELGISVGTLSRLNRKNKNLLPHTRQAEKKNSPIYINVGDVVEYFLKTTKTM